MINRKTSRQMLFFTLIALLFLATTSIILAQDDADSQWSSDPSQNVTVTTLGGDEATPKIVTMDNGNFFIAWFSNPEGENYDVRMQKYDALGNAQWEENGLVISDNTSDTWISSYIFTKDSDDNLILIFQDMRTGDKNIFAYKISQDGDMLWGDDGIQLTDNRGFTGPYPSSVTTEDNIAFTWVAEPPRGNAQLIMQKLTADGEPVWGDNGLVAPGQDDVPFTQASIASGGGEDLIMVYGIQGASPQIMAIYAQKYDEQGNPLWNDGNGIQLDDAVPLPAPPVIVSDGNGGAYIAWHNTDLKSFVQHLDSDGNLIMADGGQAVTTSSPNLEISPQVQYSQDTDELIVFWQEANSSQSMNGMSGQKMSSSGELLWDENGINYVALTDSSLGMVTPRLTDGNIVVFYGQSNPTGDPNMQGGTIYAQLVDGNGDPVGSGPSALTTSTSPKQNLGAGVVPDQNWITVWAEQTGDTSAYNKDIYMQNLPLADSAE